ncbi:MAG: LemA family protein [Anaerovoracaceae bacterium]
MKKRHKDIGDIVGISGEYIGKENMLLKNLLGAYNKVYYARNFSEKVEGENLIDIALNDYFEKISSQIELTENSTWKDIKSNIFETEIKIAEAIIEYNHSVRDYNTMIELFPNHIIAKMFMFDKKPIFANKKDFQKIIGH